MSPFRSPSPMGRRLLGLCVVLAGFAVAGCGESEKLFSVAGKVTSAGQPVTSGVVTFTPDSGDKLAGRPVAMIEADGSYEPVTNGKKGVPAGKYKVTVSTMAPPGADAVATPSSPTPKAGAIHPRYTSPDTSGLTVEVPGTAPDAFDLKLLK